MRATPREGNLPIVFSHVLTTTPRSKAPHGRGLLAAESVEASLRPSKAPRSWLLAPDWIALAEGPAKILLRGCEAG